MPEIPRVWIVDFRTEYGVAGYVVCQPALIVNDLAPYLGTFDRLASKLQLSLQAIQRVRHESFKRSSRRASNQRRERPLALLALGSVGRRGRMSWWRRCRHCDDGLKKHERSKTRSRELRLDSGGDFTVGTMHWG
jgi:hypothetical protein